MCCPSSANPAPITLKLALPLTVLTSTIVTTSPGDTPSALRLAAASATADASAARESVGPPEQHTRARDAACAALENETTSASVRGLGGR